MKAHDKTRTQFGRILAAAAVMAMAGGAVAEPDGTLVNTGAYMGTTWGKTTLWVGSIRLFRISGFNISLK